jgi:hypothetical protein
VSTTLATSELAPLLTPASVSSGFDQEGVPLGITLPDRRPFLFDPVAIPEEVAASPSMAVLGEMGSGKSTMVKAWATRSLHLKRRGLAVIDAQGENGQGEWAALASALGAVRIRPGEDSEVRINPLDPVFGTSRVELVTALVMAASGHGLEGLQGHALRCAVARSPDLGTLITALGNPLEDDARIVSCTVAELASAGGRVAASLTRYTSGDLAGLFDGPMAGMPMPSDPFAVFDLSGLDPYSPSMPVLMLAIAVWAERAWGRAKGRLWSTLVVEEAWHLLDQPSTTEALRRMLKHGRKTRFTITAVTHTLADLTTEKARDLVRLAGTRVFHRMAPTDAQAAGREFGLPEWAIKKIPSLAAGEAIWQVGRDVRVVRTLLAPEDLENMTTSSARKEAQGGFGFTMPPNVTNLEMPSLFKAGADEERPLSRTGKALRYGVIGAVAAVLAAGAWGISTLVGGLGGDEPLAQKNPDALTEQQKAEIFTQKSTVVNGVPMQIYFTPDLIEVDTRWSTTSFTAHRFDVDADGKNTHTSNTSGAPALLTLTGLKNPQCVTVTVAHLRSGEKAGGLMEQESEKVCKR